MLYAGYFWAGPFIVAASVVIDGINFGKCAQKRIGYAGIGVCVCGWGWPKNLKRQFSTRTGKRFLWHDISEQHFLELLAQFPLNQHASRRRSRSRGHSNCNCNVN